MLLAWMSRDRPISALAVCVLGPVAVASLVQGVHPGLIYRGLSGVTTAMLALVCMQRILGGPGWMRVRAGAVLATWSAKTVAEAAGISSLDSPVLPAGVVTVPASHAAGLVVGVICALAACGWRCLRRRALTSSTADWSRA